MIPSDGVPLHPSLTGLAALVSARRIQGHLINRPPGLLEPDDTNFPLVLGHLQDIAAEVSASISCPLEGKVRELAVAAVAIGVARNLEEAMFPEQGIGDSARAEQLERRFLALLRLLARACGDTGADGSAPGWSGSLLYQASWR